MFTHWITKTKQNHVNMERNQSQNTADKDDKEEEGEEKGKKSKRWFQIKICIITYLME